MKNNKKAKSLNQAIWLFFCLFNFWYRYHFCDLAANFAVNKLYSIFRFCGGFYRFDSPERMLAWSDDNHFIFAAFFASVFDFTCRSAGNGVLNFSVVPRMLTIHFATAKIGKD